MVNKSLRLPKGRARCMRCGMSERLRRLAALPSRWPGPVRWTLTALSLAAVFWLALSPADDVPSVGFSDKIQHGLAFAALTSAYGLMFPRRRWAVLAGMIAIGVAIEVLQAVMPFGRDAELADLAADAAGILIGFIALRLLAG